MKTTCLIIDDEPLAIEIIENYLKRLGEFKIVGKARNGVEAYRLIKANKVDLLFLDIEMPDLNGLSLLRSLKVPPYVILTTAYREYALDGYDLDVIDYLLKPIRFERFLQAIDKFHERKGGPSQSEKFHPQQADALIVRVDRKHHLIPFSSIHFLEGMKDYVQIITDTGTVVTKRTIQALADALPSERFIRIHRSYIVATDRIISVTSDHVKIGNQSLPVGRSYKRAFYLALGLNQSEG